MSKLVIKAMRSFAYGMWYYLTFEALVDGNSTQIFEAKLYEMPPFTDLSTVTVEFLRPAITHVTDLEVLHIAKALKDQWTIGDSD
ncbi:hypothetical protein DCAR_0520032 [Daucus carota subsp. sativus]|uniref:Cystatin domain-containing protein n=1 Tax=Daucus carota subsp. sativus TaxID=79200 RepID=A0A162A2N5_DAUCS|nr:hypothetical protein DCAR_0520032 [Daucus carota subsp. sativus]